MSPLSSACCSCEVTANPPEFLGAHGIGEPIWRGGTQTGRFLLRFREHTPVQEGPDQPGSVCQVSISIRRCCRFPAQTVTPGNFGLQEGPTAMEVRVNLPY